MKNLFACLIAVFALAVPGYAHDVDGNWVGTISGAPQGEIPVAFTFLADGATLTGSSPDMFGTDRPLEDGTVEGENIAFSLTVDFEGMPFTIRYTGVVSGDEINVSYDVFGMPFEFRLTRADP